MLRVSRKLYIILDSFQSIDQILEIDLAFSYFFTTNCTKYWCKNVRNLKNTRIFAFLLRFSVSYKNNVICWAWFLHPLPVYRHILNTSQNVDADFRPVTVFQEGPKIVGVLQKKRHSFLGSSYFQV